jgi:hypothetical protein
MDDTAVEERNEERLLALEIMDGRKCINTKKQYQRKIELNEDGSVKLSVISKAIMNDFFGHVCQKKDKHGAYLEPVVFHASQHYKSAIRDYYSNMEVNLTEDILKSEPFPSNGG